MTDHYERERELYEERLRGINLGSGLSPYFEQENLGEQVVVYAVLAYNNYYPDSDNVKGMFDSYPKAEQFLDKFKVEKEALVAEYGGNYYDHYKIVDYVLNQPT